MTNNIVNAFTVDVEDYFQVSAFSRYIPRASWDSYECRVENNIDKILSILNSKNTKATFFTLGWIAERYPLMVRRIVNEGHELASHGYGHERVTDLSPSNFFSDLKLSKNILENIVGIEVKGYRAPSFSIGSDNLWAFDCLHEAGYKYSSSIYPIKHDHYGMPNGQRFIHSVKDEFVEIPITTLRIKGKNYPSSGGGYFRLLPYFLSKNMLKKFLSDDKNPAIFYFHPWEIDKMQPRIDGIDLKTKFRHYVNISTMEKKINKLLMDFKWDRVDKVFGI